MQTGTSAREAVTKAYLRRIRELDARLTTNRGDYEARGMLVVLRRALRAEVYDPTP